MNASEEQLYAEACKRDLTTGDWIYGRRRLMKLFPEFSEWKIRNVLRDARGNGEAATPAPTPEAITKKQREQRVLSLPQLIIQAQSRPKNLKPRSSSVEHWVIGSDFHAPKQHEASCEIFYQVIEFLNPKKVFLLGDLLTLDNFSRYDKIPTAPLWIEDVAQAGVVLSNVAQAAADDTELLWFEGNHEQRLRKHLIRHDPWLYDHLNVPKLFTLSEDDRAIEALDRYTYIEDNEVFYEDLNLVIKHGNKARKHAGVSGRAELETLWMSVIVGHCHRLGLIRRRSGRSRYLHEQTAFALETGCLCDYDQYYTEGHTTDWQHGFAVLTIDRSDEVPVIEPSIVEINNGKALFRDTIFRA